MELNIAVSPGELIDKITILEIKLARIADDAKLRNVRHEHTILSKTLNSSISETPELAALRRELRSINETLWQVEEDIRALERRGDFGNRFIAAARAIYENNDHRAGVKRRINELLGSDLIEEKSYGPAS